ALGTDRSNLTGREFVRADEVSKLLFVGFAHGRVFIITVGPAGDDLPFAVAPQPGIGGVITRGLLLTEDDFGFVQVVAQHGRVADDLALVTLMLPECPAGI